MSITCQICGTENPIEGEFCEGCGTELSLSKAFSIEPTDDKPQTEAPPVLPNTPLAQTPFQSQPQADSSFDKSQQASESINSQPPFDSLDSPILPQKESAPINESTSSSPEQKVDSYQTNDFPSESLKESFSSQSDSQAGSQFSINEATFSPSTDQSIPINQPDAVSQPTQIPSGPEISLEASDQDMPPTSVKPARLIITKFGTVTEESIPLQATPLIVGKFDPSTGPVDIDLTGIRGEEYISKQHAELYFDEKWKVRDIGSTNGVYIRPAGSKNYNPRLQTPTELKDGDEVSFGNVRFVFSESQ